MRNPVGLLYFSPKGAKIVAKTNNKICKICGTPYHYCYSCDHKDPAWKQLVCSEDCNMIWIALSRNGVGLASSKETLDNLAGIPMPKTLQSSIQEHIDRLKAEVAPEIEVHEEPIVEEVVFQPKKKKKIESIDE